MVLHHELLPISDGDLSVVLSAAMVLHLLDSRFDRGERSCSDDGDAANRRLVLACVCDRRNDREFDCISIRFPTSVT